MESKNTKQKGIDARAWMAQTSFHANATKDYNDYAPSMVGERPKATIAEYWDGTKWCERRLQWNGEKYAEVSK